MSNAMDAEQLLDEARKQGVRIPPLPIETTPQQRAEMRRRWMAKHGLREAHFPWGRFLRRERAYWYAEYKGRWQDHVEQFVDTAGRRVYTSQPYLSHEGEEAAYRASLDVYCRQYPIEYEILPREESWYYPGHTVLIVVREMPRERCFYGKAENIRALTLRALSAAGVTSVDGGAFRAGAKRVPLTRLRHYVHELRVPEHPLPWAWIEDALRQTQSELASGRAELLPVAYVPLRTLMIRQEAVEVLQ